MCLSWDDPETPAVSEVEKVLAVHLLDAGGRRCRRTDLYETRNVARGAIRRRRRERGLWRHLLWRHLLWRPWQCRRPGCCYWHIGPKGNRAL